MLGVRIPEELEEKMNAYADHAGITKSQLVKQAVSQFLRQHELKVMHDEKTTKALKQIKKGEGISGDVVMKMLAQWSRGGSV